MTTNDVSSLTPGAVQYNLLTNENGGVIDDILIYRVPEGFYLVVNAANKDKDFQWLSSHSWMKQQLLIFHLQPRSLRFRSKCAACN